jgi:Tfp pilus assembly protein PilF
MQGFLILLAALAADCPPYSKGATGGDYYNAEDAKGLTVVETFHFGPQVESLQRGMTGMIGADLGYTLEHFPNHPRALAAMARLALRSKAPRAPGAPLTVECYFQRALAYVPSDGATRALYGAYLLSMKRDAEAVEQLQAALEFQETNAAAWYNLGLAQVRLKDWPAALASARKAYGQGFPLPGLRQQLKAAGQWREAESLDPMVAH